MADKLEFGWRVPDFPVDGSDTASFLRQIYTTLEITRDPFASAWVADHIVPWGRWQSFDTPTVECWTTLTFLASRYPDRIWGSIVLCQSYRNPALLAKMVANLCAFLPGKIVFGVGAGWKEDEYQAYDWNFPRASVRIQQLADTVQIAKRLWTADNVSFEGDHYAVRNAFLSPKPEPLPPIMIGGAGEKLLLRVVARHADWWNTSNGTPELYAHKLNVLRHHCEVEGTDFNRIKKTWTSEAVALGRTEADARSIADASPFNREDAIIGASGQVADRLNAWAELGVTHFILRFMDFPKTDGIQRFINDVIPKLS